MNEVCKLGNDANEDTFTHPGNSKPVFNDSKWKQGYRYTKMTRMQKNIFSLNICGLFFSKTVVLINLFKRCPMDF